MSQARITIDEKVDYMFRVKRLLQGNGPMTFKQICEKLKIPSYRCGHTDRLKKIIKSLIVAGEIRDPNKYYLRDYL